MLSDPAAIATCESEPIHLLGAIQPIGFLLSANADWIIQRASDNVAAYLGVDHSEVIGQPVSAFVSAELLHAVRGRLQQAGETESAEPLFGRRLRPDGPVFAVAIHRSGQELVLEFESASADAAPAPTAVRSIIARIERHRGFAPMFREAARQIRALTDFDRVVVYRFDPDGNGDVVGESLAGGVASFLGLRFPAADIPSQARALYERNLTRVIVDIGRSLLSGAPRPTSGRRPPRPCGRSVAPAPRPATPRCRAGTAAPGSCGHTSRASGSRAAPVAAAGRGGCR